MVRAKSAGQKKAPQQGLAGLRYEGAGPVGWFVPLSRCAVLDLASACSGVCYRLVPNISVLPAGRATQTFG